MFAIVAWLLALALALPVALADPRDRAASSSASGRRARSRSIGYPWRGRLESGVLLRESEHVRYTPEYRAEGRFYGTRELVTLIERAAARVARRLPGAKLSVGELSRTRGGRVTGHHSHQNGRDVDLSFYMLDGAGEPFDPHAFAAFRRDGRGLAPNESLRFDDARNWELVARLVTDPDARVQFIFVATTLRARLLAEGARRGARSNVLARAARAMVQPARGHPHRNHFHVRIYCSPSDGARCEDRAPYWPWYPGVLPSEQAPDAAVVTGD